ncbi:hypothetical protein [Streptomyces sp. RTd22]|uniref:hypothetical protein n=1 Tax=Streptomyces sp. RTd22 TaxID=1841249 RepID=UPI0007C4816A|nr:hypothetical protein [Streptomyces sp. RTd22]
MVVLSSGCSCLPTPGIDFDPETVGRNPFYKLLTPVVVPRPIARVSTIDPDTLAVSLAPAKF